MATTFRKIIKETGFSLHEYEEIILEKYMTLTSKMSKSFQHQQLILMDKAINKWFLNQVEIVNNEFLIDIDIYKNRSKKTLQGIYLASITKVTKHYPSALLKDIKPNNNITVFTRQN